MKTCDECHTLPECGWCDDASATGLGQCMKGGDDGPFNKASANQCPVEQWYFVKCPGWFTICIIFLRRFLLNVRGISAKIKLPKNYSQHRYILYTISYPYSNKKVA